jgi:hypothetical protein
MTLHAHNKNEKNWGFIQNKVVECIVKGSVEKLALIPSTHVLQPTSEGDEDDGIWMVWNQ